MMFIPLIKADESLRMVWGVAAMEVPDKSGEIMDYGTARPAFEKWSADIQAASNGASLGNVRLMHGKVAIGKVVELSFDDLKKAVMVCVKVVDDAAWKLVKEGVLSGFSIGGGYAKRWADAVNKSLTRYTPALSELSMVDNPCIPGASFSLVKADGLTEDVTIKADGHLAKAAEDLEPSAEEQRLAEALRKASPAPKGRPLISMVDAGMTAALAKADADPGERLRFELFGDLGKSLALCERMEAVSLEKGFYTISAVARALRDFTDLTSDVVWEEKAEGDSGSSLPQAAVDIVTAMKTFLVDMVGEETSEFLTSVRQSGGDVITLIVGDQADSPVMELAARLGDLTKAENADSLAKVGKRNSRTDAKHIQSAHDHMTALGATCDSGNCGDKAAAATELAKAENGRLRKAAGAAADAIETLNAAVAEKDAKVADLEKAQADLATRLAKLESRPEPGRGVVLTTLSKSQDMEPGAEPGARTHREEAAAPLGKTVFSDDPATRMRQSAEMLERAGYAPGSPR